MKKYLMCDVIENKGPLEDEQFYLVKDADERIDELERALKSAATVISKHLEYTVVHSHIEREALAEADRVLSITS